MNIGELRSRLSSPTLTDPFAILADLCAVSATQPPEVARELVLRALARSQEFLAQKGILDGLLREVGLFPYMSPESLPAADRIAYELHRPPGMQEMVFHRSQAEVFRKLMRGQNVILSAPTSFGKSLLIDAVIASGKFENIVIVVPTIALIDETRRRLARRFRERFQLITHPFQRRGERHIFILTQERVIDFPDLKQVDFFAVDEFYKLSPERDDSERSARLNVAFYKLAKTGAQFYLLGPNVMSVNEALSRTLDFEFVRERFQTVVSQVHDMSKGSGSQMDRLIALCEKLREPTLVFCSSPTRAAEIANALLGSGVGALDNQKNKEASEWMEANYHPEWHVARAMAGGIGIHHGRMPRALAQYMVRAFDEGSINFLVCTSTLIEGVNTKAKNVVVFDNKINRSKIDYFTFSNIRGRSGRMKSHVVGNVYVFHEPPEPELPFVDVPVFTQPETADQAMLLQLQEEDLTEASRLRIRSFVDENLLPIDVLKRNVGVNPEAQLTVARKIAESPSDWHESLAWSGYPLYDNLKVACNLIWEHFGGANLASGSVVSSSQLTFLINKLQGRPTMREFILSQNEFKKNADMAVRQTLDFFRLWAMFHFPRLLRALGRIQEAVFSKLGMSSGDYDLFASKVESLFLDGTIVALDEYGVPLETARKIESLVCVEGDLDGTLERLRKLDVGALSDLHPFEIRMITAAQADL